jgi:hypothetical protein
MDERELEQVVRAGLERRSAEADVTAPVVARVRAEVGRRRRTRWGVGAAAAAVVLVVGGVAVATRGGDGGAKEPPAVDRSTSDVQPAEVTGMRTEYWGAVAVDVPADWGYGGAPVESGGDVVACYPEAMVGPDGSRLRPGERGWVGRPIVATDVCASYPWIEHSPLEEPAEPYVWLGAEVGPGVVEYANGVVQETVEVEGVTVTVASDDAALRERILASARRNKEEACDPSYAFVPRAVDLIIAGREGAPYAWVCAYRRMDGGRFALSYADEVDPSAAEVALEAQSAAPDQEADCDYDPFEFVVLVTGNPGDRLSRTVYETGCAGGTVHLGGGVTKQMVAAGVEPWAHNGIPAVVYGPTGGKGAMIDSFIGPQG